MRTNWSRSLRLWSAAASLAWSCTTWAGIAYNDPTGGWGYIYTGDKADGTADAALDGTWSHNNGSDEWDGEGIGVDGTSPGGASTITEQATQFLRVEDVGDPRNDGFTDPGSNRKIYLTHELSEVDPDGTILSDGATISFRTRLPIAGLLDRPTPNGDGYYVRDDGKSTFTIHQTQGGTLSFALSTNGGDDAAINATGALVMNNYVDGGDGSQVDFNEAGEPQELPIADPTAWNEFWITVKANDNEVNQFDVNIYANGSTTPKSFLITGGNGNEFPDSYLGLGQHSTAQAGSVDIDFFAIKPGIIIPTAAIVEVAGGYDGNGLLDAQDIDLLTTAVLGGTNPTKFDANKDGKVDGEDRSTWVNTLRKTYMGDSNLDGEFSSADFVAVFQSGQYEDGTANNSKWGTGDWNGDGDFDSGDFVAAFQAGGYEIGPRAAVSAVPEPTAFALLLLGTGALIARRRRQL